ncbi:hypothetical protein N9Z02_00890 [Akkermansiaceae bacterium]|nr:hypothetical protein [Akkermansiaceae bacterium]
MEGDAVNQWIDARELRQLAESLLAPAPRVTPIAPEAVYGSGFVGYTEVSAVDPREATSAARANALKGLSDARGVANSAGLVATVGQEEMAEESQDVQEDSPIYPEAPVAPPVEVVQEASDVSSAEVEMHSVQQPVAVEMVRQAPVEMAVQEPVEESPQAPPQEAYPSIESPFRITAGPSDSALPTGRVVAPEPEVSQSVAQEVVTTPAMQSIASSSSPSGQPLSRRMAAFGQWLKASVPAEAFFVCDRNGEIISDEIGNDKLVKVARTLAHAASSASRQVGDAGGLGSPHVKIGTDRILQVIPKRSKFGLVVLGVIVPRALSGEAVAVIAQSLSKTLGDEVSISA